MATYERLVGKSNALKYIRNLLHESLFVAKKNIYEEWWSLGNRIPRPIPFWFVINFNPVYEQ